ncbi:MAG: hypothetical protein KJO38_11315, partial [Gammaproteobacteria bacterium]|nr:hypothetical protein [Gammaproteobacteria bacterium]
EFHRSIKIQPTDAAWVHPALLIADSGEKSIARWQTLPPLDIVNPIRRVKPGATLLLQSSSGENNDPWVAMAWQRYGRGKVVAFPVQNSWLWQMHHEIDIEDQTHELLWRQLLRWLVEDVPRRLELTLSMQTLHAGGTLRLRAEALGADFTSAREAQPLAVLTAPDGVETTLSLAPHPALPGTFEASLPLARPGDYRARLELDESGDMLRSAETRVQVNPDGDEYFGSEMNLSLLRRIGEESSGGFFAANEVGRLVDALDDNQRGSRALVRQQLWDMPILFLLLVTLLCAEWAYRRWRGLP